MTDPPPRTAPTSSRSRRRARASSSASAPTPCCPPLGTDGLNLTWRSSRTDARPYGVEVIGARPEAIRTAEDRDRFKSPCKRSPRGRRVGFAHSLAGRWSSLRTLASHHGGPSFILAGRGRASRMTRHVARSPRGLAASPVTEILVESRSPVEGVRARGHARRGGQLRDRLLDRELRRHGRAHRRLHHVAPPRRSPTSSTRRCVTTPSRACARRVETGAPTSSSPSTRDGPTHHHRDEPPRLALLRTGVEGTGFPSPRSRPARRCYRLDEIANDITRARRRAFEPSIDYVVTKIPPGLSRSCRGDGRLGTRMQSVGE